MAYSTDLRIRVLDFVKGDKYPGPKSIWIGLQRLRDLVWAIQRYQSFTATNPGMGGGYV